MIKKAIFVVTKRERVSMSYIEVSEGKFSPKAPFSTFT